MRLIELNMNFSFLDQAQVKSNLRCHCAVERCGVVFAVRVFEVMGLTPSHSTQVNEWNSFHPRGEILKLQTKLTSDWLLA